MFEEIGEKAFSIGLMISILFTMFAMILIANGVEIPSPLNTLFMPLSKIYGYTSEMISKAQTLSSSGTPTPVEVGIYILSVAMIVGGMLINFVILIAGIFLYTAIILYYYIPAQVNYLVLPLFFLGGFLQFTLWVYVLKKMSSIISGLKILPI